MDNIICPAEKPETSLPSSLRDEFIRQGIYLRNWSLKTADIYKRSLATLPVEIPTQGNLDSWVVALRSRGITPGGVNVRARSVNSYLSWLKEQGHLPARLRVKALKNPLKQKTLLSRADIKALSLYRPTDKIEQRTLVLILLLLDTGVRIDEALSAERSRLNLDEMPLVVMGKGGEGEDGSVLDGAEEGSVQISGAKLDAFIQGETLFFRRPVIALCILVGPRQSNHQIRGIATVTLRDVAAGCTPLRPDWPTRRSLPFVPEPPCLGRFPYCPLRSTSIQVRMAQRELGTVIQWNLHVEGIGTIKTDRGDNLLFERQSLNGFLKSGMSVRVEFTRTDEDFAVDVTPA